MIWVDIIFDIIDFMDIPYHFQEFFFSLWDVVVVPIVLGLTLWGLSQLLHLYDD